MKRLFLVLLAFCWIIILAACAEPGNQTVNVSQEEKPGVNTPTDAPESKAPSEMQSEDDFPAAVQESEEGRPHVLVAYFSCTGNTAPLAKYVAEITGADLYEIVAEEPYTDEDIAYQDSGCRANAEQNDDACRPAISGEVVNMQDYDVVFIAFPIWWGKEPRIIDTFMESYDFSGKTMIPFCTSGGSGISTAESDLHTMTDDTVQWLIGSRFAAGTSKDAIQDWIDSLGLL